MLSAGLAIATGVGFMVAIILGLAMSFLAPIIMFLIALLCLAVIFGVTKFFDHSKQKDDTIGGVFNKHDINLHLDIGWGDGGNLGISEQYIDCFYDSGKGNHTPFDYYYNTSFIDEKKHIFRYCIYAHNISTSDGDTPLGVANSGRYTPKQAFLGGIKIPILGWKVADNLSYYVTPSGDKMCIALTDCLDNIGSYHYQFVLHVLMHELGHTMGLGWDEMRYNNNVSSPYYYPYNKFDYNNSVMDYDCNPWFYNYHEKEWNSLVMPIGYYRLVENNISSDLEKKP